MAKGVNVVHDADAIQLSHADTSGLRQNHRMAYEALLALIDKRRTELDMSERALCIAAKVGLNTIRHVRSRGHAPKPQALVALASALKMPPDELLLAAVEETIAIKPKKRRPDTLTVYLKGDVSANHYRANEIWEPSEWVRYLLPASIHLDLERNLAAFTISDDSADLLFKRWSVVVARPFRVPPSIDVRAFRTEKLETGQRVILRFRDVESARICLRAFEVEIRENDRVIFWSRSTNPKYQTPITFDRDPSGAFIIFDKAVNVTEKVTMEPAYLILASITHEVSW